jgi:carbamoyltransferase
MTERPWVLGIGSSHNASVCLLHGDEIVTAIQEERLVGQKRAEVPAAVGSLAISYCLDFAGIKPSQLDAIGVCSYTEDSIADDVSLNPLLLPMTNQIRVYRVSHHLGHAIGVFATSGFEDSLVLVLDYSGSPWFAMPADEQAVIQPKQNLRHGLQLFSVETARQDFTQRNVLETISIYSATKTSVVPLEKHIATFLRRPFARDLLTGMQPFFSLGSMYDSVARQIFVFGESIDNAGKAMGLAPYGRPVFPVSDFFTIEDGDFVFKDTILDQFPFHERWPHHEIEYQNLAASVQAALEAALLYLASHVRDLQACPRMCYAGGVALNSVANERLIRAGGFEDVYIMPAAEDCGVSIGAAYHALWQLEGRRSCRPVTRDVMGKPYSAEEIDSALSRQPGLRSTTSNRVVEEAARWLCDGRIIGWFQEGSELGPRALGQRSILCDPRLPWIKDALNLRVKFRESFRPFAPIIPEQFVREWFEVEGVPEASPFMLRVMPFRAEKQALVPAVVHVDGTGRVQTLTPANGRLYELTMCFYEQTGVPILLNTSFNIAGAPIIETPEDALGCFLLTELDACFLMDHVVTKKTPGQSVLDFVPELCAISISEERFLGGAPNTLKDFLGNHNPYLIAYSHAAGVTDIKDFIQQYKLNHLRVETQTRWGRLTHYFTVELAEILKLINGSRTGREILHIIAGRDPALTERVLSCLLVKLQRGAAIRFLEPAMRKTELEAQQRQLGSQAHAVNVH